MCIDASSGNIHRSSFIATDALLDKFILSLSSVRGGEGELPMYALRHLAITGCIARFAVVQLHYPFIEEQLQSATRSMSICKAMITSIKQVPKAHLADTDPLLSVSKTVFLFLLPETDYHLGHTDDVASHRRRGAGSNCHLDYHSLQTASHHDL